MSETHEDYLVFSVDSHLLQELGERLVSEATVAYAELIKNAYDADSSSCNVSIFQNYLSIKDDGHGMTLDELKSRWMRVATTRKTKEVFSRSYERVMTGAKGVGRFAARTLGS
ncbi:MAG: ATP-binding protein, partial [Candidatus Thiodiazotropha endolucinida]